MLSFGQTVTISITSVNNANTNNNGVIDLGTNDISNISLVTYVNLPSPISDNNPGTINVYYQKNTSTSNLIPQGGNGGNLLFSGSTFTSRNFVINLDGHQFDTNGGFLYTEYTTYSGMKYKSSNIPIIKNISIPTPNPPNNVITQRIPFLGIPILPNYNDYSDVSSQDWINTNSPYNIIFNNQNITKLRNDVTIQQRTIFNDGRIHIEPLKIHLIVSGFLSNSGGISNNGYNTSNIYNVIKSDQYVPIGQNPAPIIGNKAYETRQINRTEITTDLSNNYQWQRRIVVDSNFWSSISAGFILYGWHDIPTATQENYTPPAALIEMEYRRLVLEDPTDTSIYRKCATSNIITIYPIDNTKNIENAICCDQTVNYNTTANPIVGAILNGAITYKWQNSDNGTDWHNISTKINHTPERPLGSGRQLYTGTMKYRRLALDHSTNLYNISNESIIIYNNLYSKNDNRKDQVESQSNSIKIYPNPSTSIISVNGLDDITSYKIKVIDATGKTALIKNPHQFTSESLQIDISTLKNGIHTLILENEKNKFIKKIIKN